MIWKLFFLSYNSKLNPFIYLFLTVSHKIYTAWIHLFALWELYLYIMSVTIFKLKLPDSAAEVH